MPQLRQSVVVQAPPSKVWAVVSSPEEMALRCTPEGRLTPRVAQVEITSPQRTGVGLAWKVTGEFRGRPYWAEHRAVAWEEGPDRSRFAYTILRDSLSAHERMRGQIETYELQGLGDGTTRVTRTSTFRLRGIMLKLLFPLFFRPPMTLAQFASLHKLKSYVEAKEV